MLADVSFFIIGWMIAPIMGVLIGYRSAPFLLKIHKKTKGSHIGYFIDEKMELKEFKFTFQNLLFPALLAMNLAMIISSIESIQLLLIKSEVLENLESYYRQIFLLPPLIIVTATISTTLFSAAWFLLDAGIVFVNKEKWGKILEPIKISPVGQGYISILKGYAGISVILNLLSLVYSMATGYVNAINIFGAIMWALNPLILSFILIPMMILLDKFHNKGKLFILKHAKKLDITENLEALSYYLNKEKKRKISTDTVLI
jgi:hypothetical protein